MKIAILVPQRVYLSRSPVLLFYNLSVLLNKAVDQNFIVKIFSVWDKNYHIEKNYYSEEIVQNSGFIGNKNLFLKLIDAVSLLLFNTQFTYTIRNTNPNLYKILANFGPEIIITGYEFTDFANNYKLKNPNLKIIAVTDDIKQVLDIKKQSNTPQDLSGMQRYYSNPIMERYSNFLVKKYNKLIQISDKIVLFTNDGLKISKQKFNKYNSKFTVIPLAIKTSNIIKNPKTNKIVKNVLFLGTCGYKPNDEAINLICKNIAPKLPNIKFLLVGNFCKKYKSKNVVSLGFVTNLQKYLQKSDICIAPIFSGGGIKTKVLEYFCARRPVIATSFAIQGFSARNGEHVIIENDIQKYPLRIIQLSNDYQTRLKMSKKIPEVLNDFSEKSIKAKWVKLIKELRYDNKKVN